MIRFEELNKDVQVQMLKKKANIESVARIVLGVVFLAVVLVYGLVGLIDGFVNKLIAIIALLCITALVVKIDDKRRINSDGKAKKTLISTLMKYLYPFGFSLVFLLALSTMITASQLSATALLNQDNLTEGITGIIGFKMAMIAIGVAYIFSGLFRLTYKKVNLDSIKGKRYAYSFDIISILITGCLYYVVLQMPFKLVLLMIGVSCYVILHNTQSWCKSVIFMNLSQYNGARENTKKLLFKDEVTITSKQYFILFRYNGNGYEDMTNSASIPSGFMASLYIFQNILEILFVSKEKKAFEAELMHKMSLSEKIIAKTKYELSDNSVKADLKVSEGVPEDVKEELNSDDKKGLEKP